MFFVDHNFLAFDKLEYRVVKNAFVMHVACWNDQFTHMKITDRN